MYDSIIDVSNLVSDQIIVIDSDDLNSNHKSSLKSDSKTMFFVTDRFHTSHIRLNIDTNELIYFPTKIIPQKTPIQYIINSLEQYCILLVENDHHEYIGYIDGYIFAKYMFKKYKYTKAFLDTIVKTTDDACTAIDKNERVLYWSKGSEKIYDIKAEEIVGKKISDFFAHDQLQILKSLRESQTVKNMLHQSMKDHMVLINSNPVTIDEENVGAVVFERDISHQVRLNDELYKQSKNLFKLERTINDKNPFKNIHGHSEKIQQTIERIKRAAATDTHILIQGESGLEKSLFAKAIHQLCDRSTGPFVQVNCGAIPETIFDYELFGYDHTENINEEKKTSQGKVELANNGTLFLDNVHLIPLASQEKLLRMIQEKKFFRGKNNAEFSVNLRIVSSTNMDLEKLVKKGKFNQELFYRINVVNIVIPPLRERPEDIIELTHYFLHEYSIKYNQPVHGVSQETMQAFLRHHWPGNTRELKNVIERLVVFSENGEIKWQNIPFHQQKEDAQEVIYEQLPLNSVQANMPLKKQLERYEREIIIRKLKEVNGNKKECAKRLDITRATLYNRMHRLDIDL